MSDNYITKEEVLSFVEEMEKRTYGDDLITKTVLVTTKCVKDFVMHMLPADVQPVVRCRDCVYWDDMYGTCYCEDFEVHCQDYYIGDMHTEPDFFCGFCERGRRRQ